MGKAENAQGKSKLVLAIGFVLVFALIGAGLYSLMKSKSGKKVKAPKISLIPSAPPPPPPPPPKIEKKPDPPKEQKEMKTEQQVPKQEAPPPSPELKMEGAAGDGPSAFSSGAVSNEDLSKFGDGKGGNGMFNPFANYASLLKGEMSRYLRKNNALRRQDYKVDVQVWVNGDGSVKRTSLIRGSGDGDLDNLIKQAIAGMPPFSEMPPSNMPQPILLRIVTTGSS